MIRCVSTWWQDEFKVRERSNVDWCDNVWSGRYAWCKHALDRNYVPRVRRRSPRLREPPNVAGVGRPRCRVVVDGGLYYLCCGVGSVQAVQRTCASCLCLCGIGEPFRCVVAVAGPARKRLGASSRDLIGLSDADSDHSATLQRLTEWPRVWQPAGRRQSDQETPADTSLNDLAAWRMTAMASGRSGWTTSAR